MFTVPTAVIRVDGVEQDQVLQEQKQAQKMPDGLLHRPPQFPGWPIPTHDNGLADDWDESADELNAHR